MSSTLPIFLPSTMTLVPTSQPPACSKKTLMRTLSIDRSVRLTVAHNRNASEPKNTSPSRVSRRMRSMRVSLGSVGAAAEEGAGQWMVAVHHLVDGALDAELAVVEDADAVAAVRGAGAGVGDDEAGDVQLVADLRDQFVDLLADDRVEAG